MRIARVLTILLLGAFAARAAEVDETVVLPIGAWNMLNENSRDLDLSALGAVYSDIYDIQVVIRTDFPDGADEVYNSAEVDRLDRFPVGESTENLTGKGGTFYLQPVNGKLTLRMFRDLGDPTHGVHGGESRRRFVDQRFSRKTYVDSKGITKTMNRGFALITFNGLKSGLSNNTVNQRHFVRSVAIPVGNLDFANFESEDEVTYGLWEKDVQPQRLIGMNMSIYSNPSNGYISIRSMNQKPSSSSSGGEGVGKFVLRTDGGSYLHLQRTSTFASVFAYNTTKFGGTSHPRGHIYLNHFPASCDDYGYSSSTYSRIAWGTSGATECSGGNFQHWVMQTRGTDIWGTSDNGQFMYETASGTNKTVQAKILQIEKTSSFGKFGVGLRYDPYANARYVGVFCTSTSGPMLHWRTSNGGTTSRTKTTSINLPVWVRVVKSGNTFWGEYSTNNGSTWTTIKQDNDATKTQTVTMTMGSTYAQGLIGSSNSPTGAPATLAAYGWTAY